MALVIVVTPGYQLSLNEHVSREILNLLAKPTIDLQGTIDQVVIADEAVTEPKLGPLAVTLAKLAAEAVDNSKVKEDAGIVLSKLAAGTGHQVIACLPSGVMQAATAVGDVTGQTGKSLPFDGMVVGGLAAGMKLRGKTSGATGEIVAVVMGGASDGRVILKDAAGTWQDNEDVECTNEVDYDGVVAGKSINVGDAVLGQSGGATGVVLSKTSSRMVLRSNTGTWLNDEGISVNGDGSTGAIVNGPYTVRCQVDLNGKTYDDAAHYAYTRERTVLPGDLLARAVALSHLKPGGTAGQVLRSQGLYTPPAWETVTFRPSAVVHLDDAYVGRKAYSWLVSSYNAGGEYLTLDAGVTMADVANGDEVCFSGPTGNLPTGVSRGVIYTIGDKETYGARTVRLYDSAGALVTLSGAVTTTTVYLHRKLATGVNCKLFKDTLDNGTGAGNNDGYYQLIFTAALGTANVVLAGACGGYGASENYAMVPVPLSATTGQLRLALTYATSSIYAANRVRLVVFEA